MGRKRRGGQRKKNRGGRRGGGGRRQGGGSSGRSSGSKGGRKKTCGACFSDLPKDRFSQSEWAKKSMDCVCLACSGKGLETAASVNSASVSTGSSGSVEGGVSSASSASSGVSSVVLELGEIPKQFLPKSENVAAPAAAEEEEGEAEAESEANADPDPDPEADPEAEPEAEAEAEAEPEVDPHRQARSLQPPDLTIDVRSLFSSTGFPPGEITTHGSSSDFNMRLSSDSAYRAAQEAKEDSSVLKEKLECFREGAEVHRQVRQWAYRVARPGVSFVDLCAGIEERVYRLMDCKGLKGGFAFPIGVSVNHQAAHWTPNPGDELVIGEDDVVKLDIGLHVKGWIIDSAVTLCWNDVFDPLLKTVREATDTGVRECGIDVRLCDIGDAIHEVIESCELDLGGVGGTTTSHTAGEMVPVKPIDNLNGHSLDQYVIHSGIQVPITRGGPETKMKEGECYAIETFGSTGRGHVNDVGECSHFMLEQDIPPRAVRGIRLDGSKKLFELISRNYSTLCFCPRWLEKFGQLGKSYMLYLRNLAKKEFVKEYPPLCDVRGSYVAQYEHTLMLRPSCKEVFSRGDDF